MNETLRLAIEIVYKKDMDVRCFFIENREDYIKKALAFYELFKEIEQRVKHPKKIRIDG